MENSEREYMPKNEANPRRSALKFTCLLKPENGGYVVTCLDLDISSQGKTFEEARDNIKEAIELYLDTYGTPEEFLAPREEPIIMPLELPAKEA